MKQCSPYDDDNYIHSTVPCHDLCFLTQIYCSSFVFHPFLMLPVVASVLVVGWNMKTVGENGREGKVCWKRIKLPYRIKTSFYIAPACQLTIRQLFSPFCPALLCPSAIYLVIPLVYSYYCHYTIGCAPNMIRWTWFNCEQAKFSERLKTKQKPFVIQYSYSYDSCQQRNCTQLEIPGPFEWENW